MLYIGKIVNTHGIKGEIRILSDFKYKEDVFKVNNCLYIDNKEYVIKSYRKHKNYDMVSFDGFNNINDVLFLKNKDVYCLRELVKSILPEDLIGYYIVMNNKRYGKVNRILKNKVQDILVTDNQEKIIFIDEFILSIDNENKEIVVGGMFNED